MTTRNPFTGHIWDPRPYVADKAPKHPKRGKPLDLTSIAHQSIAAPSDPVAKRAKLLRGSMR